MALHCSLSSLPSLLHGGKLFTPNPSLLLPLPHHRASFSPNACHSVRRDFQWMRTMAYEETSSVSVVSETVDAQRDEVEPKSVGEVLESSEVEESEAVAFLDKLNLKLDTEDTYSIVIYGVGAIAALWISSGIVRALDAVPLFPKIMEIVGLGFTIWFSYRYLIFKKNRDELFAKIDDLKGQIVGSDDD
ncbi:protein CURVATURE THYLAKOID 1D, chloroplastic isoform X2 [Dioscorea cayenensis subsp. rotundata]|uniref:Protein CURVATURE THYLAKOID 1D, chloroplastic isoform X2 n=1 Tax=Dioscorea cayennensis subsp. rotundata TaxID=55577 RepID=A0AB40BIS4_DIOCR|nr:protein CURVATURE THYLAKOID 1D, chloroplastic isoform X2 [Dioscorea cayenensis subsp. rotundata]